MKRIVRITGDEYSKFDYVKALGVSKKEVERGLELHKKSIVIDMHSSGVKVYTDRMVRRIDEIIAAGATLPEVYDEIDKMNIEEADSPEFHEEYDQAFDESGVTVVSEIRKSTTFPETMDVITKKIARYNIMLNKLRDIISLATCTEDIRRAKREGKHAVMRRIADLHFLRGGCGVEDELEKLDVLYGLGVRIVQLAYNLRNLVGDGCTERYQSGLSTFGLKVVERLNKLGMVIDVSHCGRQTTMDACEFSKDPVVATHTGCRALCDHPRNKTDEELKAIAETGGCVGIYWMDPFLVKDRTATIKDFFDHVDYATDLIGADHVGIGTDTSYEPGQPLSLYREAHKMWGGERVAEPSWWMGWKPEHRVKGHACETQPEWAWTNWPWFTVGLVSRGYSDQEIENIIGRGYLRVLEKVIGLSLNTHSKA